MRKFGAGLIALVLKVLPKVLSIFAKLLKGAKFTKLGLAGSSFALYTYLFTWQFALAIIFMLIVHESGHVWAMKKVGMKTKGIYFIPFLGAAAVADEMFPNRKAEVFVAIMGPIWGFALAILVGSIYFITGNAMWAAIAGWMAFINLFNLLPINPLDGGRILKSIAFSIHSWIGITMLVFGLAAAIYIAWQVGLILFAFLAFVGIFELVFEWKRRNEKIGMTAFQTMLSVISYLIVVGSLWGTMLYFQHIPEVSIAMEILMG